MRAVTCLGLIGILALAACDDIDEAGAVPIPDAGARADAGPDLDAGPGPVVGDCSESIRTAPSGWSNPAGGCRPSRPSQDAAQ